MFELRLLCPEDHVETVSDALDALDALSVSVEDADAQTDAEQALFGEPGMPPPKEGWQRSRVIALFPDESSADEAAKLLQLQDFFADCRLLGLAKVPDEDWVRLTQSQFSPVEITPEFWIVPTWHEPPGPGAGLRHRHPPDHPHVPALDCAAAGHGPARPRAGLRLRFGHFGHRCRQAWRPGHRRGRHR